MTIDWTETERLHLIQIISGRIYLTLDNSVRIPNVLPKDIEQLQLIYFLAATPASFLERNKDKFAEALAEYQKEVGTINDSDIRPTAKEN